MRYDDNIRQWTRMEFGDSLKPAEDRYCCKVICGAPTSVKIKGLR